MDVLSTRAPIMECCASLPRLFVQRRFSLATLLCILLGSCSSTPTQVPSNQPPKSEAAQASEFNDEAVPTKKAWISRILKDPEKEIDLLEGATVLASDALGRSLAYSAIPRSLQPILSTIHRKLGPSPSDAEKLNVLNQELLPAIRKGQSDQFRWLYEAFGGQVGRYSGGCAANVILYSLACDSLNVKVDPVCIPLHVYLSHITPQGRRDIETTDGGQSLTSMEYRLLISKDLTDIETLPEETAALEKYLSPITRRQFIAMLLCQVGTKNKCLDDLESATRIAPDFYYAWKVMGGYFALVEQYEASEKATSQAIALAPFVPGLFGARANVRVLLSKLDQALADIEMALKLAPNYAQYHLTKALVLDQLGRLVEAEASCSVAVDSAPSVALFFQFRGRIRTKLKKYDAAIEDYTKAIALEPKQAVNYERRSYLWAMVGNEERYLEDRDAARKLSGIR